MDVIALPFSITSRSNASCIYIVVTRSLLEVPHHFLGKNQFRESMPLEISDATLSDFDRVFEGFQGAKTSQPALKFLLFLADKDPSTKLSWCPGLCSIPIFSDLSSLLRFANFVSSRTTAFIVWSTSDHFDVISAIDEAFYSVASLPLMQFIFLQNCCCIVNDLQFADCNVAEPVIYKKLEASSSNVGLLRAYVGDRSTWRNPSHPWRVDPRFKLKGVPTLIRWEKDAIAGRLEDYEAHVEAKIDSLLASK
ncbi:hypothetical protein ZIOFF_010434 [Zingiber officinale]|uniref:Thioredoxin domain-containing protein n=1 Tax=Zingiber officinale TaxID=94328 RepID=A0A8J5HJ68_ZINOF|nr:hypothetical protein ZIOFF_010434 [Zingiber officinale]